MRVVASIRRWISGFIIFLLFTADLLAVVLNFIFKLKINVTIQKGILNLKGGILTAKV
jgi:hypothetical protein